MPTLYDGKPLIGVMPIASASANALTTSLATMAGSWWRLDPADWITRAEYRVIVMGQGLTSGDVLLARLNDVDAGVALTADFATAADGKSTTITKSPWLPFPTSPKSGFLDARNATAARGVFVMACIQIRVA